MPGEQTHRVPANHSLPCRLNRSPDGWRRARETHRETRVLGSPGCTRGKRWGVNCDSSAQRPTRCIGEHRRRGVSCSEQRRGGGRRAGNKPRTWKGATDATDATDTTDATERRRRRRPLSGREGGGSTEDGSARMAVLTGVGACQYALTLGELGHIEPLHRDRRATPG